MVNHDPLCGWSDDPERHQRLTDSLPEPPEIPCSTCELIAKVREDERTQRDADMDHASYVLGQTAERQRSVTMIADAYKRGRESALLDAVEAVNGLPKYGSDDEDVGLMRAAAAIEALSDGAPH